MNSRECFCNHQFNVKACSIQGIFKTSDVVKNDPESLVCPVGTVDVMSKSSSPLCLLMSDIRFTVEQMIRFPIPNEELQRLRSLLPATKPAKPYAFIFGHGLWNDLDLQITLDWLDLVLDTIGGSAPWLSDQTLYPRLILTPNASGKEKLDEFLVTQGNKALQLFEEGVKSQTDRRGVEHLGTWNMSIQANKFDGVHLDLKGNMVKAMMVLNWLDMIDVDSF